MRRNGDHTRRKPVLFFILSLLLLAVFPASGLTQEKSYYWPRFDVEITINKDGTFRVVETQTLDFTTGTFHYGYRNIDLSRVERITDVQVWGDGVAYRQAEGEDPGSFHTERKSGDLYIYWYFEPTHGEHTYVISYVVHGGLRYYDEGDQLWWKAVPSDLGARVDASRVVVNLPEGARADKAAAYGVASRVSGEGTNRVTFTAEEAIFPGDEFEVRVQFPHGIVSGSPPAWQIVEDKRPIIDTIIVVASLLFLSIGIVGVILLWYTRGRDPNIAIPAEIITEPPTDDPPGVVGTLVDEHADTKDVIATLVDLARRGYLMMAEGAPINLFGFKIKSSEITYVRTSKPATDLLPYERQLLDALFNGRMERRQSDINNHFYRYLPAIKRALTQETVRRGYFPRDPASVRRTYGLIGILLGITGACTFIAMPTFLSPWTHAGICPGVVFFILGILLAIIGQFMPRKTRKGAEAAARWKAFQRYLASANRYTDLKKAADLYERYLPYAIAFGMERRWTHIFSQQRDIIIPLPVWYRPYVPGGMSMGGGRRTLGRTMEGHTPSLQNMSDGMMSSLQNFSDNLISALNSTASAMTSSPSSSGGGGGGGGGFG